MKFDFLGLIPQKAAASRARALTTSQIAALSDASLDALNPDYFLPAQIAGLTAAYVGALSIATFDASIARHIAALSPSAAAGLSLAEIQSLTLAENSAITVAQFEGMGFAQREVVLAGGALIKQVKSLEIAGALTYSGMLQLLRAAAIGGMNAIKFDALQWLAANLNSKYGITSSASVEQIAQDVIDGNSANAYWHGGASKQQALGNLTASSSQAQMDKLIGKWFLGADLPSLALPVSLGYPVPSQYQAVDLPLFGPGGPSYRDVNQGNLGDGYFLAALAETAYTDPTLIKDMIHENPNGTYSVRFQVDGEADYVTVNNELPVMLDYYQTANGSTLEFANSPYSWSLLIEKAYVQLVEQTGVTSGSQMDVNGDAYADVAGGGGNGISVITGDSADFWGLAAGESSDALGSLAADLRNDLLGHQDVLFASSSLRKGIGDLVNNQMFEVLGVNVAARTVLLQNPWNGSGLDSGKPMRFWESLAHLAMDGNGEADPAGFYVERVRLT